MGKIYVNENQILLPKMLEIYKPVDFDWMHFSITRSSIITIHHIDKISNGGKTTFDNCALLIKKSHRLLNMLESKDNGLYIAWNDLFREINLAMSPPDYMLVSEMKTLSKKTKSVIYR